MEKKLPRISIIIPTYNSKEHLKHALISIEGLKYPKDRYDVVIADDGSTDGTEEMVAEIKGSVSFKLEYCWQENSGPGAARNLGISKATGDLLAFTDSDCTVHKNWLESYARHFEDRNVGIAGGPALARDEDAFFLKCANYCNSSFIGTGGMRRGKGLRLSRYYPRSFNMVVSRKAIDKAGNFRLSEIYGEDTEFSYRIKEAGFSVAYAPDAIVWHSEKTNLSNFVRQVYKKGRARIRLARMHRGALEPLHVLPSLMIVLFFALAILSMVFGQVFKILAALASLYVTILLISGLDASIKLKDVRAFFAVPPMLFLQHFYYGAGVISELISNKRSHR